MDFFDKEAKRAHARRLLLGYGLVAIAVGLATLIVVYTAQGIRFSATDGVVQTGLVYIDSKPVRADVYIDAERKGSSDTRLSLDSGKHTIRLVADKYREWKNEFQVEGASVDYFTYINLLPINLTKNPISAYESVKASIVGQSKDRKWLIIQPNPSLAQLYFYESSSLGQRPPIVVDITPSLELGSTSAAGFSELQWLDDSQVLLRYQDSLNTVVLVNRESGSALNITKLVGKSIKKIIASPKDKNSVVVLGNDGVLQQYNFKDNVRGPEIASSVTSIASTGIDAYFLRATADNVKLRLYWLKGDSPTLLRETALDPAEPMYMTGGAYRSGEYIVISLSKQNKVQVYKNPKTALGKDENKQIISNQFTLSGPTQPLVSADFRQLAVFGSKSGFTYDFENNLIHRITLSDNFSFVRWIDNYRLYFNDKGRGYLVDFDGANKEELGSANGYMYLDTDKEKLIGIGPTGSTEKVGLFDISLVVKN